MRLKKLTKNELYDLSFDLINAFSLVKTPFESASLISDLLTKTEVKNLAKRLRIAKLIISGKKQEEIIEELHCSFGTIARVNTWLNQGGEELKKIIKKLPKRTSKPSPKYIYPRPNLPHTLAASLQEFAHSVEQKRIQKFLKKLEEKHLIDKHTMLLVNQLYKQNK